MYSNSNSNSNSNRDKYRGTRGELCRTRIENKKLKIELLEEDDYPIYNKDEFIRSFKSHRGEIIYPLYIKKGVVDKWRYVDKYNNVQCNVLSKWPGSAGIIPCCNIINSPKSGLSDNAINHMNELCNKKYGENWRDNYDGDYDCCENTCYQGIPMNYSLKDIRELPKSDSKLLLLIELLKEEEVYKIRKEEELCKYKYIIGREIFDIICPHIEEV